MFLPSLKRSLAQSLSCPGLRMIGCSGDLNLIQDTGFGVLWKMLKTDDDKNRHGNIFEFTYLVIAIQ